MIIKARKERTGKAQLGTTSRLSALLFGLIHNKISPTELSVWLEDVFFLCFGVAQHLGRLFCAKKYDRFSLAKSNMVKN